MGAPPHTSDFDDYERSGYCAADLDTGFVFYMICLPASWPSLLPPADNFSTASTTEIEPLAAAKAITEGLRLRNTH